MFDCCKKCFIVAPKHVQFVERIKEVGLAAAKDSEEPIKSVKLVHQMLVYISTHIFIQDELKQIQTDLKKLKIEEDRLKVEMKASFLRLTTENQELTSNFLPLFKNLIKAVRQQSN